jgi:carboxymethylenebutenolidase
MTDLTELAAADGHVLSAYEARPGGEPRGGVVIAQEIFGVTAHIRDIADAYAAAGYHVLAPALFDRQQRGVLLPYSEVERARAFKVAVSREDIAHDVGAAVAHLAPAGRVGIVGYCWGGLVAWIAAATTPVSAAVAYYGGGIHEHLDLRPVCPVMLHYGEKDPLIPLEVVERVRAACPQGVFHFYPAGHGFNCTDRTDYDADCAQLAFERTLGFLRDHVG